MASLNRVELIGKLADDPEIRYTPEGKTVASFVIDVENEQLVNFDYIKNITNVFPIKAWGELGMLCTEYLHKGNPIYLEGYLITTITEQRTTFHDEEFGDYHEDEIKYFFHVVAKKIELLENKLQDKSITGNKEKILEAIQRIENAAFYPNADSGLFKALELLKSLDFDNID